MATPSSILAWRIPWTEEPGKLQSMGCKEPDMTKQLTHTYKIEFLKFHFMFLFEYNQLILEFIIRDYKDRIYISLPSLLHEIYHVPWFQLSPLFVDFTVYLFNLDRYHELQYHISNCLQGISTWESADHCKLTRIYYYRPTNLLLLHLLKKKKKKSIQIYLPCISALEIFFISILSLLLILPEYLFS